MSGLASDKPKAGFAKGRCVDYVVARQAGESCLYGGCRSYAPHGPQGREGRLE
jgi:hypothetical protein